MVTVGIILGSIVLALLVIGGIRLYSIIAMHGPMTIITRWLIGRHHAHSHHERHTSATFLRGSDGNVIGRPAGRVLKRHHRAGWINLARAFGWLVGFAFAVYGALFDRLPTFAIIGALLLSLISVKTVKVIRAARKAYDNQIVVRPLARALAPIPGTSESDMETNIKLRPDYTAIKRGEIGRIYFPDTFRASPMEIDAIGDVVGRRMPMDVDISWHPPVKGEMQYAKITTAPPLPSMVRFAEVLPALRELANDDILLGVNAKEQNRVWDMKSEEPMMFVSATTRRGKTTLAMMIMAQILNRGGSITAIDPKAVGLDEFCAGHPNAKVYADNTNVETMWAGIKEFRNVLDDRINRFKDDRTIVFPRMTLILDEVSVFNMLSTARWDMIKPPKGKSSPPVWNDIMAIIFTGAQFNVNCCIFGQRVDFRTLGGLVDGFGTRLLAGYNKQTYMRLVGEPPVPKSQKARGRFLYFNNGDEYPEWIQVPYGSIQEMRDFAFEPVRQTAKVIPGKVVS